MTQQAFPAQKNAASAHDPSLTLPQQPKTRANQNGNSNDTQAKNKCVKELSLAFNAAEWKSVFSRIDQEMKSG